MGTVEDERNSCIQSLSCLYSNIYIYIYIYICVCVCVCDWKDVRQVVTIYFTKVWRKVATSTDFIV
jgi:hypothetical protein